MRKMFINATSVVLSIIILLCMSSCQLEESYNEFVITNIADFNINEYTSAEELDFTRLNNITIVPEIKEINHGEYIVYVTAYSESNVEHVLINKVTLFDVSHTLWESECKQNIVFADNTNNQYEGSIKVGSFTENDTNIFEGKNLSLIIEVEIDHNGGNSSKDIIYEIIVKGYKSFVLPT